ncbi:hypothetical protein ACHAPT_013320 [Fusarium lateritium]
MAAPSNISDIFKSRVPEFALPIGHPARVTGATGYVARIEPVFEDTRARMHSERNLTRNVESSLGRTKRPRLRMPKLGQRPPVSDRVTTMTDVGEHHCPNCEKSTHNMDRCLKVLQGSLLGCTLCRSMNHFIDDCETFAGLTLEEKVKLLVFDRYRMPPLKTKIHWFQWLSQWLSHPDSCNPDGSTSIPGGFPWSEEFTIQLAVGEVGNIDALQDALDNDVAHLPKDPATADFVSAFGTYNRPPST